MKIRVMGTEEELCSAVEYYRSLENEDFVKSVIISKLYPNRGSRTIYRLYIDVEYYTVGEYGDLSSFENEKKVVIQDFV